MRLKGPRLYDADLVTYGSFDCGSPVYIKRTGITPMDGYGEEIKEISRIGIITNFGKDDITVATQAIKHGREIWILKEYNKNDLRLFDKTDYGLNRSLRSMTWNLFWNPKKRRKRIEQLKNEYETIKKNWREHCLAESRFSGSIDH